MRDMIRDRVLRRAITGVFALPASGRRWLAGQPVRRDGLTLDTDTQCLLRLVNATPHSVPSRAPGTLRRERLRLREGLRVLAGEPVNVAVRDLTLPGAASSLPGRLFRPEGAGAGLLLYFHGGGFVLGDRDSHDALCRLLAARSGVTVLLAEYRKAPEHVWPAPLADAEAIYRHVQANAATLGIDPARLVVGGDSAGANIATGLARRLRHSGLPAPRGQLLIYPATDFTGQHPSRDLFADGFLLTRALMTAFRELYIPPGTDVRHPDLSPLFDPDLSGMPETVLVTAGFDPLRDEGEAYAAALARQGVSVTLRRHDGLVHGFANLLCLPAARAAVCDLADRLRAWAAPQPAA